LVANVPLATEENGKTHERDKWKDIEVQNETYNSKNPLLHY